MDRRLFAFLFMVLSPCWLAAFPDQPAPKPSIYDFSLVDLDGKVVHLSDYKGKVLLIVNLASQSEYNDQLQALSDLQKSYADRGLVILGIPSRDFGGEELSDTAAVHKYYTDLHASFSIFAPATLHGVQTIPLYKFLCNPKESVPGGDVHWNFTKFLIGRDGEPIARYEVSQNPADVDFHVLIENALNGKLKKDAQRSNEKSMAANEDDE